MKKYATSIVAIAILLSCSDDDNAPANSIEWSKTLNDKTVNEIVLDDQKVYVATTTGLYVKETHTSAFTLIGFENKNVEALEVMTPQNIFVSIVDKSGAEPPALYKSVDGGEHWLDSESKFGGQVDEPVFDLEIHPELNDIIFATGYNVVAKSVNGGLEWTPIYGNWGAIATGVSVVEVNPYSNGEIWAGGQGAIENGFLLRSTNESDWDHWNDLVENPTVVKEITFSDKEADEVLVGFEGALLKTTDSGAQWQTLIDSDDNRFFFGIARRKGDSNRVYAGGWLKTSDPQPLVIYISDDAGLTWREHTFTSETYGGIFDMQIKSENGFDKLYVGLDKGGVYEVTIRD